MSTTYLNSGLLRTTLPASLLASPGAATAVVKQCTGTSVIVCGLTSNPVTFTIAVPTPVITSISPTSVPVCRSDFTLVVTGTGFLPTSLIRWNNTALTTTYVSATQVRTTVPQSYAYKPGDFNITVAQTTGETSSAKVLSVVPPYIGSLSPDAAVAGHASFTLTVNGSNFLNGSTVRWNTTMLQTTYVSSTQLLATVPASLLLNVGTASVTVIAPCGFPAASRSFSITPASDLKSLNPASVAACGPAFQLTVFGGGFVSGAAVRWGGSNLQTTFINSNQLMAVVPATLSATPGPASITVILPDGGISNAMNLVVQAPAISLASPSLIPVGSPDLLLTVDGSGFVPGTSVVWNTYVLLTTYISSNQLTAIVPAIRLAAPGQGLITVVNPCGTSSGAYTVTIGGSTLLVTGVSPSTASACGGNISITVTGTGFQTGSIVRWGNTPLPTVFVSSTQLSAIVGSNLMTATGTFNISVLNPGGQASNAVALALTGPTISSLNPSTVAAGSPGLTLTVSGTGFAVTTQVRWNNSPLATAYVSATQLTAVVPASLIANAGTASITVLTSCGGVSASSPFTIAPSQNPTITSLSPSSAIVCDPAFTLSVTGTNFNSSSKVQWGSTPLETTFVTSTQLAAQAPAAMLISAGSVSITVLNSGGLTSTSVPFDVRGPAISSINPTTAVAGTSSFTLTVIGTGFSPQMIVLWGTTALQTAFINSTQLSATVAANLMTSTGQIPVTVTTPCARSSTSTSFNLTPPPIVGVTVAGLPSTSTPAQQHRPVVNLSDPYPLALTGEATISFAPASDLANLPANFGTAYQQVQFATGGVKANFSIPPGSRQVELPMIQTGTVAGRISVSVTNLRQGDAPITLPSTPVQTLDMPSAAPRITDLQASRTASGFELRVTGDSCIREVTELLLTFRGPSGSNLQTTSLSIPASTEFGAYFAAATSSQYGGSYLLTVAFVVQGDQTAVNSATVTMRSRAGSSAPASINF